MNAHTHTTACTFTTNQSASIFSTLTRKQADALFDMMLDAGKKCSDACERLCGLEAWAADNKVNDMWVDQNAILRELNNVPRYKFDAR